MKFADSKNGFLQFRGKNTSFPLNNEVLKPAAVMKDLGVHLRNDLTWSSHIEEKLKKFIRIIHFLRRNISANTISHAKLCLYKSMILPIISYASPGNHLTKTSVHKLGTFQKRVLRWVLYVYSMKYQSLLERVNMLPLSLFFENLDLLELLKICQTSATDFKLWNSSISVQSLVKKFELLRVKTEKAQNCFRTCRVAIYLPPWVDFYNPLGLINCRNKFFWGYFRNN